MKRVKVTARQKLVGKLFEAKNKNSKDASAPNWDDNQVAEIIECFVDTDALPKGTNIFIVLF